MCRLMILRLQNNDQNRETPNKEKTNGQPGVPRDNPIGLDLFQRSETICREIGT